MTMKSPGEMDASHRLAYEMGRSDAVADPEDEMWWCKAHGYPIDQFVKLTPEACLYEGRSGPCEPVQALVVIWEEGRYSQLDGFPTLYQLSPRMIPHLEALGVGLTEVSSERIAAQVLNNLDLEAAQAAYEKWMDLDVVHIEYHREATGGGPVEGILAAARKGNSARN